MQIYGFERYGEADVEGFLEVPEPEPADGQVLIELVAAGLNPADIKVRAGERQGKVAVTFPMAMGREAAGRVVHDPSGTFAPRTMVFGGTASGHGALGERVLLDLAQTAAVPEGVTAGEAACIPVALGTALDALDELDLKRGETLLVLGAGGGVGVHAVQLARLRGVRVFGVASGAKAETVGAAGGEHIPSGPRWTDRLVTLSPQVDAVLDTVGGPTLDEALPLLADPARLRSTAAVPRAREAGGSGVTRRRDAAVFAELADLVAREALIPVISERYTFADAPRATAQVAGGHTLGKVVVVR